MISKCKKLKDLLTSNNLSFLMECHDGLSAKIVEETGFKGGWISGLSLSASHGVKDRNELSFKEVADACYYICNNVNIPMLLDMDTGYGDKDTASIAIKMIEKAGVAGVCIEDKLFPKHNSFLSNSGSDLEDPYIHAEKIKAIKRSTADPDFVVIARIEALISGEGTEEALRRAKIYSKAGADGILIHSKKSDSKEIDEFCKGYFKAGMNTPIVIVPTKYYSTPTDHFKEIGVSLVIWANHNLRASIKAMETISRKIYNEVSIENSESQIVSVSEVFRLQGDASSESKEIESLSSSGGESIILSAGPHDRTFDVPKSLVKVNGDTVLSRQVESYKSQGIFDTKVVINSQDESYFLNNLPGVVSLVKAEKTSSEVDSTYFGVRDSANKLPLFISYGDIVFKSHLLDKLSKAGGDITLAVDPNYDIYRYNEYIYSEVKYSSITSSDMLNVKGVSLVPKVDCSGSWVGILRVNTAKGLTVLSDALSNKSGSHHLVRFLDVLDILCRNCEVTGVFCLSSTDWIDIETAEDIMKAEEL